MSISSVVLCHRINAVIDNQNIEYDLLKTYHSMFYSKANSKLVDFHQLIIQLSCIYPVRYGGIYVESPIRVIYLTYNPKRLISGRSIMERLRYG